MLGQTKGTRLNTFADDYVVFDLETTGMSDAADKIVEISAIKVRAREPVEEFSSLVNPGCHISSWASAVNGIYDHMVENEPGIEEVLPGFVEFIGDLPLVGHNIVSFDMKFIYRDCEACFGKIPGNDLIDTLTIARSCMREMAHHRLTDLAEHFGIPTEGAHRALNDCRMTQQVYERLRRESELVSEGTKTIPVCSQCGREMKLRNGRFGEFWGCTGYPDCRFTMQA